MNEAAIARCFIHSAIGVFSVLFFLLAASSGVTALIIMNKFEKDNPLYAVIAIRLKFGVAYAAIGTLLLLLAFVLGITKAGFGNAKAVSSFILLFFATSLPFIGNLKSEENYRRTAIFLIILGVLSVLNMAVGNLIFTGFHNYL